MQKKRVRHKANLTQSTILIDALATGASPWPACLQVGTVLSTAAATNGSEAAWKNGKGRTVESEHVGLSLSESGPVTYPL